MIYGVEHTTADNGMTVNSTVELAGNDDERPYWRVTVRVDHAKMYVGDFETKAEADEKKRTMHRAYMEAHAEVAPHQGGFIMPNGYEKHHPVDLTARADMIESVFGLADCNVEREIAFAVKALDENDPASLRWLACLCARRVIDIETEA